MPQVEPGAQLAHCWTQSLYAELHASTAGCWVTAQPFAQFRRVMRAWVAQPSGSVLVLQAETVVLNVLLQPTLQVVRAPCGVARQPFSVVWQAVAQACPGPKQAALSATY